jgi:hypothetical protein
MDENDLIFNYDGGIHSGGFSLNKIMINNPNSQIKTLNTNINKQDGGNKVSDIFNNLVVPSWLYTDKHKISEISSSNHLDSDDDVIDDSLYGELLKLVTHKDKDTDKKDTKVTNKHKYTKKQVKNKNKKHTKRIRKHDNF